VGGAGVVEGNGIADTFHGSLLELSKGFRFSVPLPVRTKIEKPAIAMASGDMDRVGFVGGEGEGGDLGKQEG
jgi:hypothetical protein